MSALLAAGAAAAAVLLLLARVPGRFDPRLLVVPAAALLGLAVVALGFGSVERLPLLGIGAAGVGATYRQLRSRRHRAEAAARSAAVLAVCEGLASDLRSGQPPLAALQSAAREWPEFRVVADAGRLGSDVPAALRRLALLPGAGGLGTVAAAWVIAHRSGAGLADAVGLAARTIRDERATARVVETEMAAARSTARLLAVLPVGVLLIGRGTGGDPFGFLLGTPAGLVCLSGGSALTWAGLVWLERIARSVQG